MLLDMRPFIYNLHFQYNIPMVIHFQLRVDCVKLIRLFQTVSPFLFHHQIYSFSSVTFQPLLADFFRPLDITIDDPSLKVKQRTGDKARGLLWYFLVVSPPPACKPLNNMYLRQTQTDKRRHWQVESTFTPDTLENGFSN